MWITDRTFRWALCVALVWGGCLALAYTCSDVDCPEGCSPVGAPHVHLKCRQVGNYCYACQVDRTGCGTGYCAGIKQHRNGTAEEPYYGYECTNIPGTDGERTCTL